MTIAWGTPWIPASTTPAKRHFVDAEGVPLLNQRAQAWNIDRRRLSLMPETELLGIVNLAAEDSLTRTR